ncbi:hypothetical protein HAALTHF_50920n [Vreelandella aquamarina]|nr:hypothetical protein HAALTHF_50920n [Halomonas axialensis]
MNQPTFRKRWLTAAIAVAACSTSAAVLAQQNATSTNHSIDNDGSELSTLTVTGDRLPYGMTENSNSYTSESTSIGLVSQSVQETPQSISVVTRDRLDDQGTTTLSEAPTKCHRHHRK